MSDDSLARLVEAFSRIHPSHLGVEPADDAVRLVIYDETKVITPEQWDALHRRFADRERKEDPSQ